MLYRGVRIVKTCSNLIDGAFIYQSRKIRRYATSPSGAILPEPKRPRFGIIGVICAVSLGLFIGATISKNIANFLEENELFVPEEDDDDD